MKPRTAVTLAIFCLLLLGFGLVNGGVVLMALPFVLYLVLSLLYTPEELNLHITRNLSDSRVPAESEVTVTISVTNNGRSLRELLLSDDLPKGLRVTDGGTQKLLALAAGESHTFTYKVQVPRGQYNFSPIIWPFPAILLPCVNMQRFRNCQPICLPIWCPAPATSSKSTFTPAAPASTPASFPPASVGMASTFLACGNIVGETRSGASTGGLEPAIRAICSPTNLNRSVWPMWASFWMPG